MSEWGDTEREGERERRGALPFPNFIENKQKQTRKKYSIKNLTSRRKKKLIKKTTQDSK